MVTLGSNFQTELTAAGLVGLPFSWGSDGTITFSSAMTQSQQNAVLSVVAAHTALADAKADQIAAITQSCAATIVSGFLSSALGTAHTYPSQPIDQSNLIGAVASGLANVTFWCADSTGVWNITSHTAAQIKQVLADGGTQRMAYSTKLAGLAAQVQSATTVAAVQAIVW